MKELVVISGKGGTGKTSIVSSFAALAENAVLADCDVDAADLHLILQPEIRQRTDFSGGRAARIVADKCVACGECFELCRFRAILEPDGDREKYEVDPIGCEGCGVCYHFCEAGAILFEDVVNGELFISDTRRGPMVHAKLGVAEENSGKLVSLVRKKAREIAERDGRDMIIVDGSPGIGCPVIASITGADELLIITEPTMSGAHDLERVAGLAKHFEVPAFVCINKYDLNAEMAEKIAAESGKNGAPVIGRIPYDRAVTYAQVEGKSIIEYGAGAVAEEIRNIWSRLANGAREN